MGTAAPPAYSGNGGKPLGPPGDEEGQGIWACGEIPLPPGLWATPPDSGAAGGGFSQGGVLDGMAPGPELGLLLPADVAGLGDAELTGVLRGWRRMGSWAAAMEHAAAAELVRRRVADAEAGGARGQDVPRYAAAEVAAALTLTSRSADGLMGRAITLAGLPATWAALAAGQIDVPKALVILNGVSCLSHDLARTVEAQVVADAAGQTTGQLRKEVAAAVIAADPAAASQRVAEAQKSARVERWAEPAGTVAIAGRDLPPAEALAASNRINALAAALKADGAPGGMDLLRSEVFLDLLLGRPAAAPATDAAAGTTTGPADQPAPQHHTTPEQQPSTDQYATAERNATPGRRPAPSQDPCGARKPGTERGSTALDPAGLRRVAAGPGQAGAVVPPPAGGWAGMAGSVNLTVPLRSLLGQPGQSVQPAEIAGFGPISPSVTAEILTAARSSPGVRWCLTVTDDHGRAVGHGCATRARGDPYKPGGWGFTLSVRALAAGQCRHWRESAGYKPPPLLRHLIQTRHRTCTSPGCGRPAQKCDLDHTVPYDDGGRTCQCNMAPLCRFHHRVKQADGWQLTQPRPGVLEWITPSGWRYTILPSKHPI